MDVNSMRLLGTAIAIGMGTVMPALAIGLIGAKSVEAIAIYALVMALIIKFIP